ncbi:MAG: zf-HC2 domain-containing protein [Archangiaceae bacterium]|nr:zf-HC2 domain-containing protein [Archangiaceae bacterium]
MSVVHAERSACVAVRRCLSAFVDGESVPLGESAMQAHLEGCTSCAADAAELRAFRGALRSAFVLERAPVRVSAPVKLLALARRPVVRWAAAAALLVCVASAAALALETSAVAQTDLEVVAAHQALARGRLPLDFVETDAARLGAALKAQLGFELALPELARSKLALLGARLVRLAGQDAAVLELDQGGRRVSLAVQARRGAALVGRPVFRSRRVSGYELVQWDHGSLSYTLVSDDAAAARAGCAACHVSVP